jgi:sporulation protein YlmC with PRC-barrel domain
MSPTGLQLARDVLDKEILDRAGFKAGKVDDIVLELRDGDLPLVRALVTQESLANQLGGRMGRMLSHITRLLLGTSINPVPIEIEWSRITRIDVTVHVDLDRDREGLQRTERFVWEQWIRHLPLADR